MIRARLPLAASAAAAFVSLVSSRAWADDKAACAAAYDQTQTLRDAGKLIDARQQALTCSAPRCPSVVVKDCTQWLADIEGSLPTVVFEVLDASGHETTAARVTLDGRPWPDALDGHAKPIDPGKHLLRYAIDGASSIDETVQIRQGEKNRKLTAAFTSRGPVPVVTTPLPLPLPASEGASSPTVAPWIIGGVGLVGLVSGAVMGGLVVHDHTVATDPKQCSATLMKCTAAGASAEQQGKTLGPATTVALAVGGAAVGVAAVWLIARPRRGAASAPPVTGSIGASLNGRATTWHVAASW